MLVKQNKNVPEVKQKYWGAHNVTSLNFSGSSIVAAH